MADYRRKLIMQRLLERLRAITKANGYGTDAGNAVYEFEVELGPEDPSAAIALAPGDSITDVQVGSPKVIVLPIGIHALAKDNLTDPLLVVENLIGDIKKAIESPETAKRDLDGLAMKLDAREVTTLPRREGSITVGMRVGYDVTYSEKWGDPEQAE